MSWATTLIDKTHNSSHKKEKREILEELTEDSGGSDTGAQRGERGDSSVVILSGQVPDFELIRETNFSARANPIT